MPYNIFNLCSLSQKMFIKLLSQINKTSFFLINTSYNFASIEKEVHLGRNSMNLKMGIVGMANVGKSTTFNLLTNLQVPAENYPFCTIDPNLSIVQIPDPRFEHLCNVFEPKKRVPATLSIIDIAGLVKGASEGYGLGNEFLSHIQAVDGIYHVIRGFDYENIVHTEGVMDPFRDLNIIIEELIAKDMQLLDKRLEDARKKSRNTKDRDVIANFEVLSKVKDNLKKKISLKNVKWTNQEKERLNKHLFLTTKPMIYLINLSKMEYQQYLKNEKIDKKYIQNIEDWVKKNGGGQVIPYSAEFEQQNPSHNASLIKTIVMGGYKLLNFIHFFTVGSDEVRCWTIREKMTASEAGGLIHTDFQRYFVSAEVVHYDDFLKMGPERMSRGVKKEGKNYVIRDGDIITFKSKKN